MLSKAFVMRITLGVLIGASLMMPSISHADWSIGVGVGDVDHHDRDRHERDHFDRDRHEVREGWRDREARHSFFYYRDHPSYGYRMHYAPEGGYTIWVNGVRYYYYDGLYYIREGFDYVLVNPPMGAYVSAIPPEFQPVSINGRIYYVNNGIYYILTEHHGYKVVPPPVVYAQPAPVIVEQPPVQQVIVAAPAPVVEAQDSFPVNVPNKAGGYTTVLVKKSGSGYVGPQGEFYANFPTVAQLKAMYAK